MKLKEAYELVLQDAEHEYNFAKVNFDECDGNYGDLLYWKAEKDAWQQWIYVLHMRLDELQEKVK